MDINLLRNTAKSIFNAAVSSVLPDRLIKTNIVLEGNSLRIRNENYPLGQNRKVYIFGSGKASLGMAKSLQELLYDRLAGGVIVSNQQTGDDLSPLEVIQGSHPVPNEKSIYGAECIINGLSALGSEDFFIYLLSGGSSAIIEKPAHNITLAELQDTTKLLLHNNVEIQKINTIRKHLSMVKGGRLGQYTKATGIVLVISDVIGDDLSVIGSGPFYPDPTSYRQCREILERAGIWDTLTDSVRSVISLGEKGDIPETPKSEKENITHYLLGTNRIALEHACSTAEENGMHAHILTSSLSGEAKEVAKVLVALAQNIRMHHEPFLPPVCLLFGGETTVAVKGNGKGGRNQELALAALAEIGIQDNILLLSGGTDGIDGNSTAAGAFADSGLYKEAAKHGLSIEKYLDNNNSNSFFRAVEGLLEPGSTGTNVMDITLVIIDKEDL